MYGAFYIHAKFLFIFALHVCPSREVHHALIKILKVRSWRSILLQPLLERNMQKCVYFFRLLGIEMPYYLFDYLVFGW